MVVGFNFLLKLQMEARERSGPGMGPLPLPGSTGAVGPSSEHSAHFKKERCRRGSGGVANYMRREIEPDADEVHIQRLEIFAHIGVPDEERAAAQRLTFDITFWPVRQAGELEDQIAQAVNYASVCAATKKFVAASRDKLIETLADSLARHLLGAFQIRRITIELRKYILPDVEFVSVIVTRERPEK